MFLQFYTTWYYTIWYYTQRYKYVIRSNNRSKISEAWLKVFYSSQE